MVSGSKYLRNHPHLKPASQFCQSHSSFRLESPKLEWADERDGLPRPLVASTKGVQNIACNFVDHFSNNITAVSRNTHVTYFCGPDTLAYAQCILKVARVL